MLISVGLMKGLFSSPLTGVVLASVCTVPGKLGFILVLDGKTFKEVARAYMNNELHRDMHGYFIPQ